MLHREQDSNLRARTGEIVRILNRVDDIGHRTLTASDI